MHLWPKRQQEQNARSESVANTSIELYPSSSLVAVAPLSSWDSPRPRWAAAAPHPLACQSTQRQPSISAGDAGLSCQTPASAPMVLPEAARVAQHAAPAPGGRAGRRRLTGAAGALGASNPKIRNASAGGPERCSSQSRAPPPLPAHRATLSAPLRSKCPPWPSWAAALPRRACPRCRTGDLRNFGAADGARQDAHRARPKTASAYGVAAAQARRRTLRARGAKILPCSYAGCRPHV